MGVRGYGVETVVTWPEMQWYATVPVEVLRSGWLLGAFGEYYISTLFTLNKTPKQKQRLVCPATWVP